MKRLSRSGTRCWRRQGLRARPSVRYPDRRRLGRPTLPGSARGDAASDRCRSRYSIAAPRAPADGRPSPSALRRRTPGSLSPTRCCSILSASATRCRASGCAPGTRPRAMSSPRYAERELCGDPEMRAGDGAAFSPWEYRPATCCYRPIAVGQWPRPTCSRPDSRPVRFASLISASKKTTRSRLYAPNRYRCGAHRTVR